ncbi:MAG: chemotaxis protein CheD [Fimbriimonadaceae bacterium]|nr:chemotaxis protein CheD [Fimbriimonadaceae bacterium]
MRTYDVEVGEIKTMHGPGTFRCKSVGSCVVLIACDPIARVAGVAHIMLPAKFTERDDDRPGKYATTGVPELLRQVEELGASRDEIRIALVGGAQIFSFRSGSGPDFGRRNGEAVIQELAKLGLRPEAHDLGGTKGRSLTLDLPAGTIKVTRLAEGTSVLCTFGEKVAKAG